MRRAVPTARTADPGAARKIDATGLDPVLSVYFNLVRVGAALVVLFSHYCPMLFGVTPEVIPGHDAVVVFFVLSGYVIAYVSEGKDGSLRDYVLNRLSRLWSVAVPALALAGVIWLWFGLVGSLKGFAPEFGVAWVSDLGEPAWGVQQFARNTLFNLGFLGEGWGGEISAPYNGPYWSLNNEAWYYAIFGAWAFLSGRARTLTTAAMCVLAGPIVLALMPSWLLGAVLYRCRRRLVLPVAVAPWVFAATLLGYVATYRFELVTASRFWLKALTLGESYHLGASTSAIGDAMLAVLVAANFVAAANWPMLGRCLLPLRGAIAQAASYTFSIYLFHFPLLVLIRGGLGIGGTGVVGGTVGGVLAMLLAGAAIVALAQITEHRQRAWRGVLDRWVPSAPRTTKPT